MLRRTKTYIVIMVLFSATGLYSFWLFFQWSGMGAEAGMDMEVVRRNMVASLIAGLICVAGVIALTIIHIKKTNRDI